MQIEECFGWMKIAASREKLVSQPFLFTATAYRLSQPAGKLLVIRVKLLF